MMVAVGKTLAVQVRVTGSPQPKVEWIQDERLLKTEDNIKIEQQREVHRLVISDITEDFDADYICQLSNPSGEVQKLFSVIVTMGEGQEKPSFSEKLQDQSVAIGDEVEFTTRASGAPEPEVNWYLNGKHVVDEGRFQVLEEEDGEQVFAIDSCHVTDGGVVKCVAKNSVGEVSTQARLTVTDPSRVERSEEDELKASFKTSSSTEGKSSKRDICTFPLLILLFV